MKLRAIHRLYLQLLEDHKASPSNPFNQTAEQVAEQLGCDPMTVYRLIKKLEAGGVITVNRKQGCAYSVYLAPDPAEVLERQLCPVDPSVVALLASGQITMQSTFADLVRVLSGVQNAKHN